MQKIGFYFYDQMLSGASTPMASTKVIYLMLQSVLYLDRQR